MTIKEFVAFHKQDTGKTLLFFNALEYKIKTNSPRYV